MNDFTRYFLILLPALICANVLHMLLVKKDIFRLLNIPLSLRYFGKNKTWRGIIIVPTATPLFVLLFNWTTFPMASMMLYGLFLGTAYVMFELPNSFLKRKLGVGSGEASQNRNYALMLLDKTDSAFGVALVYFFMADISLSETLQIFLINSLVHITLSLLLVSFKIKSAF